MKLLLTLLAMYLGYFGSLLGTSTFPMESLENASESTRDPEDYSILYFGDSVCVSSRKESEGLGKVRYIDIYLFGYYFVNIMLVGAMALWPMLNFLANV